MTILHPSSFPHVFDAIIDSAPPESLPTLRQVCHFFRHRADKRLARQLTYTRKGCSSTSLHSTICPSVWRPCWQQSRDVRTIDFNFERKGHFLDSRLWHKAKAGPRYPSLKYARFLKASALLSPDPYDDEGMRMQPIPTAIVPRVAGCDYSKRRGGMDQVYVHPGTERVVLPTAAKHTETIWEAKLWATPSASVDVTVLLLNHPSEQNAQPTSPADTKLPMLETIVKQLMAEFYAGHAKSFSLVGLDAWRSSFPELSTKAWSKLIQQRIKETIGRSEYRDFDATAFLAATRVLSTAEWRSEVGEDEWELAESSYAPHREFVLECGWDPKAVKAFEPVIPTRP